MSFKAVIFDLDGTLLDTLEDIADAANSVLTQFGFPTHPVDAYRYFVGDGVGKLIDRILPEEHRNEATLKKCLEAMREAYIRHLNIKTKPYDGIPDLLEKLKVKGLKLGVLSNKPDNLTQRCITEFFGSEMFDPVIGQREELPKKPDPAGALLIAREWKLGPSEILYVGDTATDMQTASSAGMYSVGVLWGFRTKEELVANGAKTVISHPMDLMKSI